MPRKTKSIKDTKAQPTLTDNDPQPTLTDGQPTTNQTPRKDRGPGGQFAKGNPGGPGNPHARSCARMLEVFRNAVSEEDMIRIVQKLIEKAAAGDTSAAKLIVAYRIGKPLPGHHPDSIDRDEWDHYQKDAMNDKEMAVVMNALPTSVGNNVARISLPIMTAARTHDLAMKLREGCPTPEAPAAAETRSSGLDEGIADTESQRQEPDRLETTEDQRTEKNAPLPNRKNGKKPDRSTATEEPSPNGKKNLNADHAGNKNSSQRSTNHDSRSTTKNADGKKMDGKKMKKRRASWLQPLAKQLNDD